MIDIDWKTAAVLIVGGVVVYFIAKQQIAEGVTTAAKAVNPLDSSNIFNSAANATGAALTGNQSFSLGAWIYDLTHPGQ